MYRICTPLARLAPLLLLALVPRPSFAAPGNLLLSITNPTPAHDDDFGASIASVGGHIVVGAPMDDTRDLDDGAAYLFDKSGQLLRTFYQPGTIANRGVVNGFFGTQVAAYGDDVLISALKVPGNPSTLSRGRVYLYDQVGSVIRTFSNPAPMGSVDNFGASLSVDGRFLVVGARAADVNNPGSGGAFLFDIASGTHLQTYLNPNPEPLFGGNRDNFGNEVDIFGDRVYVTASHFRSSEGTSGAVYVYDRDSGQLLDTFHNPDPATLGVWANSLTVLDSGRLLIGTHETPEPIRGGVAQVISSRDGSLAASLRHPFPSAYSRFGGASTVLGSSFVVGSPGTIVDGEQAGSAFVYDRNGQLLARIDNPTPMYLEVFSETLAAMGNDLLVGTPRALLDNAEVGAVYLHEGVVPEPSSFVLAAVGIVSLILAARTNIRGKSQS